MLRRSTSGNDIPEHAKVQVFVKLVGEKLGLLGHIGGAEVLQTKFGAQVVMGGPDWDLSRNIPIATRRWRPSATSQPPDGMKLTLGDTTVTIWLTPGHTEGTPSYTFTVFDNARPVQVAYSGGTAFNFPTNPPELGIRSFQTYIESQRRMPEKAAAVGATVLLSNHSEFDNPYNRNRMLAGRGSGPHPYELGTECAQQPTGRRIGNVGAKELIRSQISRGGV